MKHHKTFSACRYLRFCSRSSLNSLRVVLQVVLDCSLDTCFTYIYQYEPYLKDPVGFPRVMVSLETEDSETELTLI